MTKQIVGKAVFTVGVGLEHCIGTLFLAEPSKQQYYLSDCRFHTDDVGWKEQVLQHCCQALVANKKMRADRRYAVTIYIYAGDRRIGVVGRAGLRPTDEILTHPMVSDDLPPAIIQAGKITFLSTASSKDIFEAAVAEILDAYAETPRREPESWALSLYREYGSELHVYTRGNHFGVLRHAELPLFDQAWAAAYFADVADGSGEQFGEEREIELEKGSPFTADEIELLKDDWRFRIEASIGERSGPTVYSVVEHKGPDDSQFASMWELSGYSFDDFQASFSGFFSSYAEAVGYLESEGEIIAT